MQTATAADSQEPGWITHFKWGVSCQEDAVQVLHSPSCFQAVTTALAQVDREKIYQWINELSSPETRENALLELSKKRESVPDLAPMLWHSCGTIAALLQVSQEKRVSQIFNELVYNEPGNSCFTFIFARKSSTSIHRSTPPHWRHTSPTEYVTPLRSSSVWPPIQRQGNWIPRSEVFWSHLFHPKQIWNRCVLSFYRSAFLAAHIPLFLYPFLHTVSKTRPFEYLRLTSLGVIGKKCYLDVRILLPAFLPSASVVCVFTCSLMALNSL